MRILRTNLMNTTILCKKNESKIISKKKSCLSHWVIPSLVIPAPINRQVFPYPTLIPLMPIAEYLVVFFIYNTALLNNIRRKRIQFFAILKQNPLFFEDEFNEYDDFM